MLTDEQQDTLKALILEYGVASLIEGGEQRPRQIGRIIDYAARIASAAPADGREAVDERALPPLPEPYEIDWPELHSQALGCGVEDRNIRDRYEAAEYGWQNGVDKATERVPEEIFTADQMREYARAALATATAAVTLPALNANQCTIPEVLATAPTMSEGAGKPIAWTAGALYDAIEQVLLHYRHSRLTTEDGESQYPLTDLLTPDGNSIQMGYDEIRYICDAIYNEVLTKHPAIEPLTNAARKVIAEQIGTKIGAIDFTTGRRISVHGNELWCCTDRYVGCDLYAVPKDAESSKRIDRAGAKGGSDD